MTLPAACTLRPATVEDATTIQAQRDAMFTEMGSPPERVAQAHAGSLAWFRAALEIGTYTGILIEEAGRVVGGAGVVWLSLPPSPRTLPAVRAYIDNVYVQPSARGRGLAGQMVRHLLAQCAQRGVQLVSLHATEVGRPIYTRLGFETTNEMRLMLETS